MKHQKDVPAVTPEPKLSRVLLVRVEKALQTFVSKFNIPPAVQARILEDVANDGILPILHLNDKSPIQFFNDYGGDELFLQFGPRDFQWDNTGELLSAGTCIGKLAKAVRS